MKYRQSKTTDAIEVNSNQDNNGNQCNQDNEDNQRAIKTIQYSQYMYIQCNEDKEAAERKKITQSILLLWGVAVQ